MLNEVSVEALIRTGPQQPQLTFDGVWISCASPVWGSASRQQTDRLDKQ
jgi:hypothetical protein